MNDSTNVTFELEIPRNLRNSVTGRLPPPKGQGELEVSF